MDRVDFLGVTALVIIVLWAMTGVTILFVRDIEGKPAPGEHVVRCIR